MVTAEIAAIPRPAWLIRGHAPDPATPWNLYSEPIPASDRPGDSNVPTSQRPVDPSCAPFRTDSLIHGQRNGAGHSKLTVNATNDMQRCRSIGFVLLLDLQHGHRIDSSRAPRRQIGGYQSSDDHESHQPAVGDWVKVAYLEQEAFDRTRCGG